MADVDIGTLAGKIELDDKLSPVLDLSSISVEKFDELFGRTGSTVAQQAASFGIAEIAVKGLEKALDLGVEALEKFADIAMHGAAVADVEENFDRLTASTGRLSSTLLNELREGTHNTIDDFELMKIANDALAAGVNMSDEQFRTLANGAFALAQAKSIDVKEALTQMNDAMTTGRTKAIELMTGKIDLVKAEDDYAKKLGTTSDRLTEQEKIEARREAILKSVGEAVGRLGEQTDGLDEKVAQVQAAWKNFEDELGKTIATSPVLMAGFDAIRDALQQAFGGTQQDLIKTIAHLIDEGAIHVLEFAKYISDGIGIAARVWYGLLEILVTMEQGVRAITYAVEGLLLGLMKVANFLSGGLAFNDWINGVEKDMDRLYSAMAEGENKIQGFKKSADDWSVATGHVNDAIDKITTRMKEAGKAADDAKAPTEGLAQAQEKAAASAEAGAKAQDKAATSTRLTKDEAKKLADAMAEIASAGTTAKETISTIDPVLLEHVKTLMAAGVSASALGTAYGLTATQLKALTEVMKDEKDAQELEQKRLADSEKRWADYYKMKAEMSGSSTQKINADIRAWEAQEIQSHERAKTDTADFYDWVAAQSRLMRQKEEQDRLESDVNSKAHFEKLAREAQDAYDFAAAHADQYTQAHIDALRRASAAAADAAENWKQDLGGALDELSQKVQTLSGEWMTLDEYQKRQSAGSTSNLDVIDQFTIDRTPGGADALLKELSAITDRLPHEKDSMRTWDDWSQYWKDMARYQSLRNAYDLLIRNSKGGSKGFADGGIGDFGSGTMEMLHGQEAIIPLNSAAGKALLGGGSGVSNTFYVNGTAQDVARQISNEIMRSLKYTRQFGSA